jgi:hypothetical protein
VRPLPKQSWMFPTAWLAGLSVMAAAQCAIRRDPNSSAATVVFLAAAAVVAVLLGRRARPAVRRDTDLTVVRGSGRRRAWGVVGVAVGGLTIAASAVGLCIDWASTFYMGWAGITGGVALLSVGLWALDGVRSPAPPWSAIEVLAVAGLVALGAYLRFHRYADFPGPFSTHAIEEQQTGLAAYNILMGQARPWEFMLDYHLAALALWLSRDPTFLTIRIPFTIASTLTIFPVYLLLRRLVSRPVTLAGTFLYSVSSWNLLYSRCAHPIFLTNLLVVIVLLLLVQFGQSHRLAMLPWLGLLSGYTLYSYAGYRGTPLFVLAFLGSVLVLDLWRWWHAASRAGGGARRLVSRDLAAIGVVTVLGVVVAAPMAKLLWADTSNPYYYFEAGSRSLANKQYYTDDRAAFVAQRFQRVRETARIFMHVGDGALTFNDPGMPMLDPVTAVCFTGGLMLMLCFPWRGDNAFFLLMFATLMLVGTVFVQNLDVRRLQGITVFVVIFSAVFLEHVWRALHDLPRRMMAVGVPVIAAGLGAYALWWSYNLYFHRMAENPRVREAFKNHYTTLIRYGRERYRREHGGAPSLLLLSVLQRFFDPGYYYGSHYTWLHSAYMHGKDLADLGDVLPPKELPLRDGRVAVAIQEPYERRAAANILTAVYPGTRCSDFVEPDIPRTALTVCDLPEDRTPRPLEMTLKARYWIARPGSAVSEGTPFLERSEPFIGYAFVPPRCYDVALGSYCLVEWTGTFNVAVEGEYQLRSELRGRSHLDIWIDGKPVRSEVLHLAAGRHSLTAKAQLPREAESGVRLSWVRNGQVQPVPFYSLEPTATAAAQD